MADVADIAEVTATGDVTTDTSYLHGVTLTGGSDAATLEIKAGGSSGTTVLNVKAAIDTTVAVPLVVAAVCPGGIHATISGTNAAASIVHS